MGKFIRVLFAVALAAMSVLGVTATAVAAPPQGKISGHVYLNGGTTPIENATVYAEYHTGGPAGAATTDSTGAYLIVGLVSDQYVLHVTASTYQTTWYNDVLSAGDATLVSVTEPNTTSGIDFTMARTGTISGHIYEEDGTTPLEGAEVVADYYDGAIWANSDFSAADGSYSIGGLISGDYQVHAVLAGYVTMWYENTTVELEATRITIAAPADVPNINIRLPEAASISGHIYEADGTTPIKDAEVVVDHYATNSHANTSWTAADGSYTVGGLLSGDYHVHALKTDYATMWYDNVSRETLGGVTLATKITVTAPADVPDINIRLPLAGKISGYVYEANGTTPIAGAMVVADYKDGSSYLYVNAAETGIDGSYSINGLVTDNYFLHAVANGHRTIFYNQHVMEYDSDPVGVTAPGTTPGINFSLPLVGSISGTVYEQDGITPVAGARVIAYYWSSGSFGQEAYTDAEGKYKIEGLGATYFAVRADITGFDTEWYSNKTAWEYLDINTDRIQVVPPADVPGIDFTLNSHAPRVATVEAGNVASTSVTLNGNLTWVGTETSIAVSFEYGQTEGGPYTAVAAGTRGSIGSFATDVSGLTPGTTYYFRAKAVASGYDPVYGDVLSLTTPPVQPVVSTGDATSVTATTATLGGNLTSLGTPAENVTVSFEWGTVAGGPYPSYSAGQTMTNTGTFSASLTGLTASTAYYYRAKADGVGDQVYGLEKNFSTLSDGTLPSATTGDASNITTTTATLSGNLTGMGTATTVMVSFEYGTTTSYGSETTAQSMTAIGSATANLTGLTAGTTYHFRIKADGEGEPIEGADKEFTTSTADTTAPVISSLATSAITTKGATITWTTDEAATSQVQYGLTAEYGSTSDEVTTLSTSHSASLTDLKAGKTYHYRVISKDAAGNQKVSDDGTFTTEKSSGGGMPVWAWVLIALAAVGVVGGGAAAFFMKGRAAK